MSQFEQSDWRSGEYFILLEILSRPRRPYGGHLVVELRQGGVRCEVGGVTLEQLQLFIKPVFILFAAVPAAAHGTEQDLAGLAPPLKDHHLRAMNASVFSTNIEHDLRRALCICGKHSAYSCRQKNVLKNPVHFQVAQFPLTSALREPCRESVYWCLRLLHWPEVRVQLD